MSSGGGGSSSSTGLVVGGVLSGDQQRESSGSSGGDEDVLHVVTNVYTIPIVKPSSSSDSQEIHISTTGDNEFIRSSGLSSTNRRCRERHEHVYGISDASTGGDGEVDCIVIASPSQINNHRQHSPHVELHSKKTCRETRKITKRVIDDAAGGTPPPPGTDVTKSKFQIRSIVEIYENPIEQSSGEIERGSSSGNQSTAFFKTSTQLNEFTTKETFAEPVIQRGTNSRKHSQTNTLLLLT